MGKKLSLPCRFCLLVKGQKDNYNIIVTEHDVDSCISIRRKEWELSFLKNKESNQLIQISNKSRKN